VPLLNGGAISLDNLRGKPSVINFWASWCGPCVDELPEFEEVWRRYRGKVNFLAVATNDSRERVVEFVRQHHLTMPVAVDRGEAVAGKFRYYGLPTTVLLTAEGKIADTNTGPLPGSLLEEKIKDLLGGG
jgi:thiol-disulfide isomerase/thioredoxin